MKKRISFIFMVLLIFAMSMNAYAKNKTVNDGFSVSLTTTTCTVSGTTGTAGDPTSYALAVAIQIREAGTANVVAMSTVNTKDGAFSTTITGLALTAGASYDIYIADYEGGAWATPVTATAVYNGGSSQPGEGQPDGTTQVKGLVVPAYVTYEGATAAELTGLASSTVISLYDSNVAELQCAFPTVDAATGKVSTSFQLPMPATGEVKTYYLRESAQPVSLGYGLATDKVYIVYVAGYENGKVAMIFVDASTGLEIQNIVFENQKVEDLDDIDIVPTTGDSFWPIIGCTIGGIVLMGAGVFFLKKKSR